MQVLEELKAQSSKIPVLILSMLPEDQLRTLTLKHGASGFLTKGCPLEDVMRAIRVLAAGGTYTSPPHTRTEQI